MFQNLRTRAQSIVGFVGRHLFGTAVTALLLWLFFFGEHSIYHLLSYKRQQAALEDEIAAYKDSIDNYERQIQALSESDASLEQFAREHLLMKREQEDIFIIDE